MIALSRLQPIAREALAFVLAASCSGCDRPGTLLCPRCRRELDPAPAQLRTPQGMLVTAALCFDGVAARCIRRLKGDGETMLARPLGTALRPALSLAVPPGAWLVPVPTSRAAYRRRGYRVPELLLRRAGLAPHPVLAVAARTVDQRGLGAQARAENVRGSMRARRAGGGATAVLVDDVVTTGATLDEAARALDAAGFRVLGAVALAATPRRPGFG